MEQSWSPLGLIHQILITIFPQERVLTEILSKAIPQEMLFGGVHMFSVHIPAPLVSFSRLIYVCLWGWYDWPHYHGSDFDVFWWPFAPTTKCIGPS